MSNRYLIKEFTEFNLQRMNPDSVQPGVWVQNPSLSIDAFDKHQNVVRQALAKIGDVHKSLSGSAAYQSLKGKLALEDQDVKSLKIIRVLNNNFVDYDVYVSFVIGDYEYWGVIKNLLKSPVFKSEVFKDNELIQTKKWILKLSGFIINSVKNFIKPEPGVYQLINNEVICYSAISGKMNRITQGTTITVLKTYDDHLHIEHDGQKYTLKGDNFVYFNWWFNIVE